jgi:hypothetical protein
VRFVLMMMCGASLIAQTRVDLKSQSKNADYSNFPSAAPFPVGTALPATCAVGNVFFKSDAVAGANLYGCVGQNTWVVESTGAGGGGATGLAIPLGIQKTGTTLTIGQGCSVTLPCLVRVGSVTYAIVAAAAASVNSGTGRVYFFVDRNGILTAGTSTPTDPSISCSGCQVSTPVTQFPVDSVPLGTWDAAGGAWEANGIDSRAILSTGPSFTAGPNVTLSQTAANVTISAYLATIASGAKPTCGSATQGTLWYTPGGTGAKDAVEVCAKDDTDAFAWRTVY